MATACRSWIFQTMMLLILSIAYSVSREVMVEQAYIERFDLVSVESMKTLAVLTDGYVITTNQTYSIVARVVGTPMKVTFTHPYLQVERRAPYAIPPNFPDDQLRPLNLTIGTYMLSAYVDDKIDNATTLRFYIRPADMPRRGPAPDEVSLTYNDSSLSLVMPPDSACDQPNPYVFIGTINESSESFGKFVAEVETEACPNKTSGDEMRLRLLSYNEVEEKAPQVVVFWADVVSAGSVEVSIEGQCDRNVIYGEVCVKTNTSDAFCGTSNFRTVPPLPVADPTLNLIPPKSLKLAPGDSANLAFRTTTNRKSPFGSQAETGPRDYILQAFMMDNKGAQIAQWKETTSSTAIARIGGKLCGIPASLNGSSVSLRFKEATCKNSATFKGIYETKIFVSTDFESLTVQDSVPPHFPQPVFPPTEIGKAARIAVAAVNRGGGLRADGSETTLEYQWYKKKGLHTWTEEYPLPIVGATSPSLLLPKVKCVRTCDDDMDCDDYLAYFVDVCNTFGCRRSAPILPDVLPPMNDTRENAVWNHDRCEWVTTVENL